MNAAAFELNVSLPADARFAAAMRDLAAHAARYAGCIDGDAHVFGSVVHAVVLDCMDTIRAGAPVTVIVRRAAGPVEFLVACQRRFDPAPVPDQRISVGWTHEAGEDMCRIAFDLVI
jgi:hypothetical protein